MRDVGHLNHLSFEYHWVGDAGGVRIMGVGDDPRLLLKLVEVLEVLRE